LLFLELFLDALTAVLAAGVGDGCAIGCFDVISGCVVAEELGVEEDDEELCGDCGTADDSEAGCECEQATNRDPSIREVNRVFFMCISPLA